MIEIKVGASSEANSMKDAERRYSEERPLLARVILGWHTERGVDEWQRRFGMAPQGEHSRHFMRYQQTVMQLQNSSLADPALQLLIAREQMSGSMEWAYGVPIEHELPGFEGTRTTLGQIARRLEQLTLSSDNPEQRLEGRMVVHYRSHDELAAKAKEFYAQVAGEDVQGGGGTSFLLSCSLERSSGAGETVLLSPEILGIKPVPRGREGDLLEKLRSSELDVLDVTGS